MQNPAYIPRPERHEILPDQPGEAVPDPENLRAVEKGAPVTARIAAFMPGASPPLVRSAIRFISAPINDRQFANRAQQLPGRSH